jgi:hypothetical protein
LRKDEENGRRCVTYTAFVAPHFVSVFHLPQSDHPTEALSLLAATRFAVEGWEVGDPSSGGHVAVLAARNLA